MKTTEIEEKVFWTPTPDWAQSVDRIENDGAEFSGQLLKYEKQIHVPEKMRYVRRICRLSSYDDIQLNSVMQIEFDSSYQKIHIHKLEVCRGEQKTKIQLRYKQKLVQKENESHLYIFSGVWTLILIVEDLRLGDMLDFSFSLEGINPSYKGHILDSLYLTNVQPIKHVFCRVIAQSDRLQFKNHNHQNEPVIRSIGEGLSEWIWDLCDLEPALIEYEQPSWFDPYSWVQITSFASWEEVSTATSTLFPTGEKPVVEISAKIRELKAKSTSHENLVLEIIQFVKNEISYLSWDHEMGVDRAADPNEVFLRRYGDCKDKAVLLCMLLGLVDVIAFPALVHTRLKSQVANWLPSPYAFNHAIVCFYFKGTSYWIDPTDTTEVSAINQMPIPQLGYALLLGKTKNSLAPIAEDLSGKISTTVQFSLGKNSLDATMSVITNFHGIDAVYFRNFIKKRKKDGISKVYAEYYENYYKGIVCNEDIEMSDGHEENIISLNESYEVPNFGVFSKQDNTVTYYFRPFSIYERLPSDIDLDRKSPINLQYPVDIEERIIIKSSKNILTNLIDLTVENECLVYHLKCYKLDKDSHVILHSLKTHKDHIPVEDLREMKGDLQEIQDQSARMLQLPYNCKRIKMINSGNIISAFSGIFDFNVKRKKLPSSHKKKRISGRLIFWIFWILIILLRALRNLQAHL